MMQITEYETLNVNLENQVAYIEINRPDKANAMNRTFWQEIKQAFEYVDATAKARVAVLSGAGKHFSAGIDLSLLASLIPEETCSGRRRETLRRLILELQSAFNGIEKCRKPVLAAIQGGCIGAGVDMIAACDMRYCSAEAYFQIKEVDLGITADVGTLQRLPHLIADGLVRELAYTGRRVDAEEAQRIGLVNRVFADRDTLLEGVTGLAEQIASKSPLAIRGIKEMVLYARDHSVADSLNYVATWNAAMLISKDSEEIHKAGMEKRKPRFED
jgi:enoyl-CoA hydratase